MDLFREKHTPQTRVWAVLEGECSLKMWCGYLLWLGSAGKESACNVGDLGSIPELGRFPGEGKGYPLKYSGVLTKSQTQLSNFHTHFRQKSLLLRQSWKGLAEGRNLIKIVPERC